MDYSSADNIQNLLNKAKLITSNNSNQKSINKKHKMSDVFLTDCFLDQKQQQPIEYPICEELDYDKLFKQANQPQLDSLQELRRMIKKTNKNLNEYGRNTMNLKSETEKLNYKTLLIDSAKKSNGFTDFRSTKTGFKRK